MESYRIVLWLSPDNGLCLLQKFYSRLKANNHAMNMGFGLGELAYSVIAIWEDK